MAGITHYSTDPDANTTVGVDTGTAVFIGENCPAGNLNNGERAMAADLAIWRADASGPLERTTGGAMVGGAITDMGATSSVRDGTGTARPIGYRGLPFTASTAGRTLALTDVGMTIRATGPINIPTNAAVAFTIGDSMAVYDDSGSAILITASGGVTLRLGASATTGTRTLAQRGLATLLKVNTDEWIVANGGIS
jgi:hypothetical protein